MRITYLYFFLFLTFFKHAVLYGQVQIGPAEAPQPSALVTITGAGKGVLPPRLTSTQRASIINPPIGLLIYDITNNAVWHYTQNGWMQQYDSVNTSWKRDGAGIFNAKGTRWGINTSNTLSTAHIHNAFSPSVKFTNILSGQGAFDGASVVQDNAGNVAINNAETGGIRLSNGTGGMTIASNGDIGIATETITAPITFSNVSEEKINFYNTSSSESYGIGVQGNSLQLHADRSVSRTEFGYGRTSAGVVPRLSVFGNGEVRVANELRRPLINGNTDLLPIALGKVVSDGGIVSGTGNFTVAQSSAGSFDITVNGENIGPNPDDYIILATPLFDSLGVTSIPGVPGVVAKLSVGGIHPYFSINITASTYVNYINTQCQGNFCSVIQSHPQSTQSVRAGVNFIVYKKQ